MKFHTNTHRILMLLSNITVEQEPLLQMARDDVMQTKEFVDLIKNMDNYHFVSDKAKDLKEKLLNINLNLRSVAEIYEQYDILLSLNQSFTHLYTQSKDMIRKKLDYRIHIIHQQHLNELSNEIVYEKLVKIVVSKINKPHPEAFRDYSISTNDPDVIKEYVKIRDTEMERQDVKRAKKFTFVGGLLGFVLGVIILHMINTFTELPTSKIVFSIGLSLAFLGMLNAGRYLRNYFLSLLFIFLASFLGITILELFHLFPKGWTLQSFYQISVYTFAGLFISIIGQVIGYKVKRIPINEDQLKLTPFLRFTHKYSLLILIVFIAYGLLWHSSYSKDMNIYEFTQTKINEKISEKVNKE